jgi:hypothetical protein
MSVRDRGRTAEIAEIQKEIDAGRLVERKPYSGAGSSIGGTIGRPENMPSDARGRAAHRARREFAFEVDERPVAEAIAEAQALNTEKILTDKRALSEFLCQPKPLDEYWRSLGNKGGCPLLNEFERGYVRDAPATAATAFFQGPFRGFLQAESFRPYRGTAIEKEVLTILLDFMERNALNSLLVSNWQKTLLLFVSAHFALPWLQPQPAPPTAAERLTYTIGGRTYIGKQAIAAMPSAEFKRRLKEESGFASLVEEVETGRTLSTAVMQEEKPADYSTRVVLKSFPVTVGLNKRGESVQDLTMAQVDKLCGSDYARAMKLLGTPVKSFEAVLDTDGFILAHLEARRQQWAR